jgi:broad specificity phosphatase PhoE
VAQLVLVRHGAAEGADGRCIGHHDLALTEAGAGDVQRLAASWTGAPPVALWSSDLARARESAAPFAAQFALDPRTDARLREMHFGLWEGRTWEELEASDGDALGRWMAEWTTARAPGGESFPEIVSRCGGFVRDLDSMATPDAALIVVAHAGSIRAMLSHLLGVTARQAFAIRLDHARATALRLPSAKRPDAELLYANVDRFPSA